MKKSMRMIAVCSLLLGAVLLVHIGSVSADCNPPATDGAAITCTGTDTTGVGTGSENNTSVTVDNGATVDASPAVNVNNDNTVVNNGTINNDSGDAVAVGDGNTVTNNGDITSTDGSGVDGYDDNTITNTGSIDSTNGAGIYVDNNNQITNAGSITTNGGSAIDVCTGNTVTNNGNINSTDGAGVAGCVGNTITNNGSITTTNDVGIDVCTGNTVTNNGNINSTNGVGIQGCFDNTITNNGNVSGDMAGIVVADSNAVVNNGQVTSEQVGVAAVFDNTVVNNGTIEVTQAGGVGILGVDGNSITNNGTIDAANGDDGLLLLGDNTVVNNGTVVGGLIAIEGDSGAQVVVNNGTLTGLNGTAIDLGAGNDTVVVLFGSQVTGTINGGAGTDSFVVNIQAYATEADAIASAIASQCPNAANCTINVNGVAYVVMNFEGAAGIHIILLTPAEPKPKVICDGDVKVIKTVDGKYYDVYSGFKSDLPNGFWVGRVDLAKLPDKLKFQDKGEHNPGWYVGVTLVENNLIVLQAHTTDGTPYGKSCKVPR